MGVGKTTVGSRLAVMCGLRFVDLDHEIEKHFGMPVARVFAEQGEAVFRAKETECLEAVLVGPAVVIALGGGTLHNGLNCQELQRRTTLFCLGLPLDEIRRRIGDSDSSRPLWTQAERLYEERLALYRTAGTYVDVMGKSADDIVEHLYGVATCD